MIEQVAPSIRGMRCSTRAFTDVRNSWKTLKLEQKISFKVLKTIYIPMYNSFVIPEECNNSLYETSL